jgi:thiamine biosynthesis lipoprotein ApbE
VVRRVEEMWGTIVSIDVRDAIDERVLDDCYSWFRRVDDLFSTWRDDTEIMRIGRGNLRPEDASVDVRTVLAECEHMRLPARAGAARPVGVREGLGGGTGGRAAG